MKKSITLSMMFMILITSCTSVFYQPDRVLYSSPDKFNIPFKNIYITSSDKVKLHGWHLFQKGNFSQKKGLILFFHGNAQNLSSHFLNIAWITETGHEVIIFDYRGYGISTGSPDPVGVNDDALAAIKYAFNIYQKGGYNKFIIYGQSLGGTIALRALKEFKKIDKIDLLVLDSSFLSYVDVAFSTLASFWPTFIFSPLSYLLVSDKMSPKEFIKEVPLPLLVVHGTNDKVIPFKFGKEIYNFAHTHLSSEKKRIKKWMWEVSNGNHIDVFFSHEQSYREKFLDFIDKLP